eukprot:TRINITY_DN36282_c0_g3_i1.p1 TRINITY_DN36282_c0_g3~~TRINITY_DN36282_c0_g3_i1.p1  ORF type:complete len:399 (-),score=44.42 TRINITY_DN36282_c0_g3_i1:57-1253(-)
MEWSSRLRRQPMLFVLLTTLLSSCPCAVCSLSIHDGSVGAVAADEERRASDSLKSLVRREDHRRQERSENIVQSIAVSRSTSAQAPFGSPTEKGSASDRGPYVTLVLFDSNYAKLFPCWAELFLNSSVSNRALEVVVLDAGAKEVVRKWQKKHPAVRLGLDECFLPTKAELMNAKISSAALQEAGNFSYLKLFERYQTGGNKTKETGPTPWYSHCFWRAIRQRLHEGKHVLHSDLDIYHVGDPWPHFYDANMTEFDVLSMSDAEGQSLQSIAHMNPGYMLIRNTIASRRMADHLGNDALPPPSSLAEGHRLTEQMRFSSYVNEMGCGYWTKTVSGLNTVQCGNLKLLSNVVPATASTTTCLGPTSCREQGYVIVHGKLGRIPDRMCGKLQHDFNPYWR